MVSAPPKPINEGDSPEEQAPQQQAPLQQEQQLRVERRPLAHEDLHLRKHQVQRRCITTKPDGKEGPVSPAHISRIFNKDHPNTPSPGLCMKIAEALTEILPVSEGYDVREVRMEDVYVYLRDELGKNLDRVRSF